MKLVEFNFNDIEVKGLSIFVGEKEVACGFIGEVLKQIPHLKYYEINETNYYMDTFVIRLNPAKCGWCGDNLVSNTATKQLECKHEDCIANKPFEGAKEVARIKDDESLYRI